MKAEPWLAPLLVFLFLLSLAQGIYLIVCWFRKESEQRDWRAIKYLALFNVCVIYFSFFFSIKPPQSNHLYITFPLIMVYSLYCWNHLMKSRRWQLFAKFVFVCGIVFHIGLARHNFYDRSIYPVRSQVQSAIDNKDYRILSERRPNTPY